MHPPASRGFEDVIPGLPARCRVNANAYPRACFLTRNIVNRIANLVHALKENESCIVAGVGSSFCDLVFWRYYVCFYLFSLFCFYFSYNYFYYYYIFFLGGVNISLQSEISATTRTRRERCENMYGPGASMGHMGNARAKRGGTRTRGH